MTTFLQSSRPTESSFGATGAHEPATDAFARSAPTFETKTESSSASRSASKVVPLRGTATTADGMAGTSRTLSDVHVRGLEARGLDSETCLKLGFYTVLQGDTGGPGFDALAIPFIREGKTINHKYRGAGKRFAQDKGAPRSLFNEDCLRDPTLADQDLIITEGEFDAVAAIQSGYPKTVSVPDGAGSNLDFLADIWPLLEKVPRVVLAGDADEPGQKLNAELARRLGAARCARLEYPTGKDLNDVAKALGHAGAKACIEAAKPYPIKGLFKLSSYPPVPNLETYRTGWVCLHENLKLWAGEFCVVTGIPQHGKSTWALHMLAQLAERHGHRAAIASFEMRIEPYVANVLRKFHGGTLEEANQWIEDQFVFIDQDPSDDERIDIDWIIEKADDAVIRYGINWLLLDPWNQIQHARKRGESTVEYQERAIAELKRFARRRDVGVIVVAHPTKEVKDGRTGKMRVPGLYDIDGSAHWYNAADHGIVIDRQCMASNLTHVHVKKSRYREGGVCGVAGLRFNFGTNRFVEAEEGAVQAESD